MFFLKILEPIYFFLPQFTASLIFLLKFKLKISNKQLLFLIFIPKQLIIFRSMDRPPRRQKNDKHLYSLVWPPAQTSTTLIVPEYELLTSRSRPSHNHTVWCVVCPRLITHIGTNLQQKPTCTAATAPPPPPHEQ